MPVIALNCQSRNSSKGIPENGMSMFTNTENHVHFYNIQTGWEAFLHLLMNET
jgi:hypothetical protein